MRPRLLFVAVLAVSGCERETPPAGAAKAPVLASTVEQAKALLEQGQLDQALAKLQEAPADADSLYYQGAVWAKRAESAALPTPPPAPSPLPRGAEPPKAPEFKPEELTALEFFEKAIAAQSDHPQAHLALAELLAPHAARRRDAEEAAARKKRPPRRGKDPEPTPTPETGPDHGVDRVIRAYHSAVQVDPKSKSASEGLIRFAVRVGRLDDADAAFRQMIKDEEKPEPFIRYGDFLARDKKDVDAAIAQYKQALVWRADDDGTRSKIADIYIAMGAEHWNNQQYALAEARFHEAERFITERNSPQGLKVQDYMGKLKAIRQTR